ncbi:MAG: hypothetical protein Q8906_15495 [Bacillota bacterium]|nr:hypothetical protein [Bacillota bacterium]
MICLCEVLDPVKYHLKSKVAILESKHASLAAFGLRDEKWLHMWDIDTRLLTLFYQSLDREYDWFIVVYDYPEFCSDREIKEAIIWHEIGHIDHPVLSNSVQLECEIQCDELAKQNGYGSGMKCVLDLTLKMAHSLNHPLLTHMTTVRKIRLTS